MARNNVDDPSTHDWRALPFVLLFALIAFIIADSIAIIVQFVSGKTIDWFAAWHYDSPYHGVWMGLLLVITYWVFFFRKPKS